MNTTTLGRPLAVVDALLQWVIRLVWLNLWWVGLTLLGGVVLGFGPATVAAHTVTTRWARGERNLAVGTTMWREWRRHWSRAAMVSVLATALTASLAATWWFAGQQAPIPGAVARALSTVGLLLMAALLPHLAWVVERTDLAVGRTMLAALLDRARVTGAESVFLEVRSHDGGAQALYTSFGFEVLGVRRGYYQPEGADALVMRLALRAPTPGPGPVGAEVIEE